MSRIIIQGVLMCFWRNARLLLTGYQNHHDCLLEYDFLFLIRLGHSIIQHNINFYPTIKVIINFKGILREFNL